MTGDEDKDYYITACAVHVFDEGPDLNYNAVLCDDAEMFTKFKKLVADAAFQLTRVNYSATTSSISATPANQDFVLKGDYFETDWYNVTIVGDLESYQVDFVGGKPDNVEVLNASSQVVNKLTASDIKFKLRIAKSKITSNLDVTIRLLGQFKIKQATRYLASSSNYQPIGTFLEDEAERAGIDEISAQIKALGNINLLKTSEDGLVAGISFKVTGVGGFSETVTTDSGGKISLNDLLIGEYTFEETSPNKYVEPQSQTVTVEAGKTTTINFSNILKKWSVAVTKKDAETAISQGNATLEGAVYGIYKGGVLQNEYITDQNGEFITDFYPCADDWTLREVAPSKGYLLDPAVHSIGASAGNFTIERSLISIEVTEEIIKGKIGIIKHSDDGTTQIETPEVGAKFEVYLKSAGSFGGAKTSEKDIITINEIGYGETKKLPFGTYTVRQTEGWSGLELMPAFDVEIIQHEKLYHYIINNAQFTSLVRVVKRDIETGEIIKTSGIGFKIRDLSTGEFIAQRINYPTPIEISEFYTDETGTLMLPSPLGFGDYELVETQTAEGYILDSKPVPFKICGTEKDSVIEVVKYNMAQKAIISVLKKGEIFSSVTKLDGIYQPEYTEIRLQGAEYEIISLDDVITLDGTVRATKGEVVATISTDENGTAKSPLLYLGKYGIKETKAPHVMIINPKIEIIELEYAGQETEIVYHESELYNDRQKVKITLLKQLETDEIFGVGLSGEILNVKFGLFAKDDIMAMDGSFIPAGGLIEATNALSDGTITFETDLPFGEYFIKEIATDKAYIIRSDEEYSVVFTYQGQEISIVEIAINDGNPIENKLKRGRIEGLKVDENGIGLGGALIGIFSADETEFTTENAIKTAVSSENGGFSFENIPYGKWIIKETQSPDGYQLSEELFEVEIAENGQTITTEIVNVKMPTLKQKTSMNISSDLNIDKHIIFSLFTGNHIFCGCLFTYL